MSEKHPCSFYDECFVSEEEAKGKVYYLYCLKCTRYPHTFKFKPRTKGKCKDCGKELPESQMVLCGDCFVKNGHAKGVRITAPEKGEVEKFDDELRRAEAMEKGIDR